MAAATHHHGAIEFFREGRMMGFGRRERRLPGGRAGWEPALLTNSEFVDDRAIALEVGLLEVIQKTAATADELQKPAPAVMIFRVLLEVFRQIGDATREERDLHFGRPSVPVVRFVLPDELCFLLLGGRQNTVSLASYQ